MINNGETSGDLVQAIENIATYYEDNRQVRMDIIGALTMPALYIVMGIVVTAVMIVFVLPNYVTLFASTGATLPAPTQILLNIGEFFTNYYLVLAGLFLAGAVGFYAYFIKTENGRRTLSKILIKMPVFGEVVIMYNLSTIASTLNQMVRNKMKLLDAIAASTKIIRNTIYREIMEKTVENVSNGYPISMAMDDHYAFTPVFTKMISLGERSGSLTEMLQNLAQFNREDVKLRVTRLKKSIEPAIMIFIYALAGGLVMAIMLPSLTMIS
jgi:type IV pilus assembly protein PilC